MVILHSHKYKVYFGEETKNIVTNSNNSLHIAVHNKRITIASLPRINLVNTDRHNNNIFVESLHLVNISQFIFSAPSQ
jgi:hypothetical protein